MEDWLDNFITELFLRTCNDLETRIQSKDWYELLGIAALVRKLFLDEQPLVDKVNRMTRLPIEFRLGDNYDSMVSNVPHPSFWSLPEIVPKQETVSTKVKPRFLDREQFFKEIVIDFGQIDQSLDQPRKYSIKDIVKFEAHVMGAVHIGRPKVNKDKELLDLNDVHWVGGFPLSLSLLNGIGHVVLEAIQPLRNEMKKRKVNSLYV